MPSGSIVTCDEYGIDGLTWTLELFFVPVCEDTGSGSTKVTYVFYADLVSHTV